MTLFWNIVFIASITQGIFLSVILCIQYVRSKAISQLILAVLILLFSHNLLNNLVFWNELFETYPQLLFTSVGSRFLFAPLFFVYCLRFIDSRVPKHFLLHLIPFALIFILYAPFMFQSGEEKLIDAYTRESGVPIWLWKVSPVLLWLLSFQLIAYPLVILRKVNRALGAERIGDDDGSTQLNWIKLFSYLFLIYGIMMLLYTILTAIGIDGNAKDYPISLVMCIAIYCISYLSILNPELLKGKQVLEKMPTIKYAKSRLSDAYLDSVASDFVRLVDEHALHLDGNLKIDQVAKLISIPIASYFAIA